MISPFKHDDEGYLNWRDTHPNAFICNIPYSQGEHAWKPICVHRASCHILAPNKNGEQPWTTKKYFKICADNLQLIDKWVRGHAELPTGWQLRCCSKCNP